MSWPERIYLQVGPEDGGFPDDHSEVTWATESVFETDREYVAAAELTRLQRRVQELEQMLSDVEWEATGYTEYDIPRSACAFCKRLQVDGHAKDCKLKAALAARQQQGEKP